MQTRRIVLGRRGSSSNRLDLMRYWLIAILRDDLEHCIKIGTYGRKNSSKLADVKVGDGIVCYACRESKIIALGCVTKAYYVDKKRAFKCQQGDRFRYGRESEEQFEHRIDFSAGLLEPEIDFKQLIRQLGFIKKPDSWHAYIRRGFAEILEKDWELISSKAKDAKMQQEPRSPVSKNL